MLGHVISYDTTRFLFSGVIEWLYDPHTMLYMIRCTCAPFTNHFSDKISTSYETATRTNRIAPLFLRYTNDLSH